ncbi:MBL fold metallo-hydrolase [Georgenia sunbinii]|uniref:MBL fold metallo-hydrolase n=1 Tax=Georgenia sunbinii TaxID=3117728 RepID=UPI002F2647C0
MMIIAHRAPVFATNTLLLAAGPGAPAVLVDPGAGVADAVRQTLAQHDLTIGAVVLTHGHADHLWDCAELAGPAPVHIGADDADRLADPARHLGPALIAAFADDVGPWQQPSNVVAVGEGYELEVGSLRLTATAAPGHTPGSTVWRLDGDLELVGAAFAEVGLAAHQGPLVLTGDVLFAGSIGRCDLPGGDEQRMAATLRRLSSTIPTDAVLVPGHGPATTMARELATNPFLAQMR